MELEAGPQTNGLASALPDVGLGSVWPTAVLSGSSLAGAGAAGAWVGSLASGAHPTLNLAVWAAEHALWGAAAGALVALGLRLAGRTREALADPARRRALGVRLTVALVALALALPFALVLTDSAPAHALGPFLGVFAGCGMWLLAARRAPSLRRLDPARVAALVALVTIPLAGAFEISAGAPPSLLEVWRTLLAG